MSRVGPPRLHAHSPGSIPTLTAGGISFGWFRTPLRSFVDKPTACLLSVGFLNSPTLFLMGPGYSVEWSVLLSVILTT